MELGGLEPPTSWVRSGRKASPGFAVLRHLAHPCGLRRSAFVTSRRCLSRALDQNLTTRPALCEGAAHDNSLPVRLLQVGSDLLGGAPELRCDLEQLGLWGAKTPFRL